ncbi:MAG: ABC transporter permease [Verrucomicrobiales bacterium]|nr:ABC transporter permease [Verrucomicrobiales bacterium]
MIRRKDVYVLLFLTALITLLIGSVNLFGDAKIARYLKEVCLTLIWISSLIIAIATAARQIPGERESRTIFPLLAKPVTRGQVMIGKFLGGWVACGLALAAFYVFFCILSGSREHAWPLASYFQALWLHWMFCGIVVALTLLGSVVFTAVSSNATILFVGVGGILLLARHLHKVAVKTGGASGHRENPRTVGRIAMRGFRQPAVVVVCVHDHRQAKLAQIGTAFSLACLGLCR